MSNEVNQLVHWIWPLSIVFCGILLGFVAEKFILKKLTLSANRANLHITKVVLNCLSGMPFIWFTLLGLYSAAIVARLDLNVARLLHQFMLVSSILSITVFLSRLTASFVCHLSSKSDLASSGGLLPSTSILQNVSRVFVLMVGFLIIINSLGISITPIITALGIGGVAVSLALQDTLSNLFSGIHIVISQQVRPADFVRLESGEEGYVSDISWRSTTIRELSNNSIVVPNSKLANSIVRNYSLPDKELAVLLEVSVSYESDLKKVEQITSEIGDWVMRKIEGGVPNFKTFIRFHTFASSGIGFTVILRTTKFADQFLVKHEFIKRLHERFREENVSFSFPVQVVYLKDIAIKQQPKNGNSKALELEPQKS